MYILILQGAPNSGKTCSLNKLISMLTKDKNGKYVCRKDEIRAKNSNDCTVPIIYKDKLVAISTYGDDENSLLSFYNNYKGYADILVCPAHTEGKTAMLVEKWKQTNYVVVENKVKTSSEKFNIANKTCAMQLFQKITDIIM